MAAALPDRSGRLLGPVSHVIDGNRLRYGPSAVLAAHYLDQSDRPAGYIAAKAAKSSRKYGNMIWFR